MTVKILCWISKSLDPLLPIRVHWNGKERKRLEYWNPRTEDSGTQGTEEASIKHAAEQL